MADTGGTITEALLLLLHNFLMLFTLTPLLFAFPPPTGSSSESVLNLLEGETDARAGGGGGRAFGDAPLPCEGLSGWCQETRECSPYVEALHPTHGG